MHKVPKMQSIRICEGLATQSPQLAGHNFTTSKTRRIVQPGPEVYHRTRGGQARYLWSGGADLESDRTEVQCDLRRRHCVSAPLLGGGRGVGVAAGALSQVGPMSHPQQVSGGPRGDAGGGVAGGRAVGRLRGGLELVPPVALRVRRWGAALQSD